MYTIGAALALGYITALAGFLPGTILSGAVAKLGNRLYGSLMGFTGGLLIAFVCFEMLPHAFAQSTVFMGLAGIWAGVVAAAFLEGLSAKASRSLSRQKDGKSPKAALLLFLGVCIHGVPEGMAVGSVFSQSPREGLYMAAVIAIHCLPEAVAIAAPLAKSGGKLSKICLLALALALPIGVGSAFGAAASGLSTGFSSLFLSFAGGIMIYVTCGEILPESKNIWEGRMTTLGACAGFASGVLLTASHFH